MLFSSPLLLAGFLLAAQDYSWWNEKHNWDGVTSWTQYLIISPAYMGPNALPVPEVKKGILPKDRSFELGVDGHFGSGDRTWNLFSELFFPLFSDRVGLGISYVPFEFYETDTLTRDLRRSREYETRGMSLGDVYFGTYIQLLEEKHLCPDVLLSINLKTASGTQYVAARHTNAPGYFFDVSAGKKLFAGEGLVRSIRAYLQAGFYVYQTNLDEYMQNDAFQYGAGFDINTQRIHLEQQLGGYQGYLENGDRPLVYRVSILWKYNASLEFRARFQQGIVDFPFSSIRISTLIGI